MHIEILVEDQSGEKLLETLLPQLLGSQGSNAQGSGTRRQGKCQAELWEGTRTG